MTQADSVFTPRTSTPAIDHPPTEQAIHLRLKAAGLRLERVSNDRYLIISHRQCLAQDLTLLEVAHLIDRALVRP